MVDYYLRSRPSSKFKKGNPFVHSLFRQAVRGIK